MRPAGLPRGENVFTHPLTFPAPRRGRARFFDGVRGGDVAGQGGGGAEGGGAGRAVEVVARLVGETGRVAGEGGLRAGDVAAGEAVVLSPRD